MRPPFDQALTDHWTRYVAWFRWRYALALDATVALVIFGPWWLPIFAIVIAVYGFVY